MQKDARVTDCDTWEIFTGQAFRVTAVILRTFLSQRNFFGLLLDIVVVIYLHKLLLN